MWSSGALKPTINLFVVEIVRFGVELPLKLFRSVRTCHELAAAAAFRSKCGCYVCALLVPKTKTVNSGRNRDIQTESELHAVKLHIGRGTREKLHRSVEVVLSCLSAYTYL